MVAAVVLTGMLAILPSRSGGPSTAPVAMPDGPPRVQVELGALERAALPLPVLPPPVAPLPAVPDAAPLPGASTGPVVLDGGIPARVLAAYRRAADLEAAADPGCRVDWALLAGIGRIESGHAAGGRVDAAGTTRGRILGPVLDGSLPGTAVILDTDRGILDGDTRFDRATGPMQFLPATWRSVGADGSGDGVADPNNVDDAALGAARYLCAGGGDLRTVAGAAAALFRYNRSATYGANVLAWAAAYRTGATVVPGQVGPVPAGNPGPPVLALAEGGPDPAPPAPPSPALVPQAPLPPAPLPPSVTPPPGTPTSPDAQIDPGAPTSPGAPTNPTQPTPDAPPSQPVTPTPPTPPPPTSPPPTSPPPTSSATPVAPAPVTTNPPTPTAPVPAPPACPAATTVTASATRVLPDAPGLLIRFALPALPAGCRMATATLRLDPGPTAAGATLTVRRSTAAWSATTTAAPAAVGPDVVSAPSAGARRITVTALVAALYAGPDYGLLVQGAGAPAAPVRLTVMFASG